MPILLRLLRLPTPERQCDGIATTVAEGSHLAVVSGGRQCCVLYVTPSMMRVGYTLQTQYRESNSRFVLLIVPILPYNLPRHYIAI